MIAVPGRIFPTDTAGNFGSPAVFPVLGEIISMKPL